MWRIGGLCRTGQTWNPSAAVSLAPNNATSYSIVHSACPRRFVDEIGAGHRAFVQVRHPEIVFASIVVAYCGRNNEMPRVS